MKKWFFLICLPFKLFALSYHQGEDPRFVAQIVQFDDQMNLEEKKEIILKVCFPKDYQLKNLAYDYESKDFVWDQEKIMDSKEDAELNIQMISLLFEADQQGHKRLNLPSIHFVSSTNPSKYISLHPPLLFCQVNYPKKGTIDELFALGPIDLEVKRPIELNFENKKYLQEQSEFEIKNALEKSPLPLWMKNWKKMTLAIILTTIGLYLSWIFLRKIREDFFSPKKIDPILQAKAALDRLKKKQLPEKGLFEEFYIEITQIIRLFIEKKYQIKAAEQTTQEFLQVVLDRPIFSTEIKKHLEDFLKFADLVKFARWHPQIEDCKLAEQSAYSFIDQKLDPHYQEGAALPNP